jgi:hypothetical protein
MSTSSSPAFSHSAIVDEALTRSAKISKVILDISRNLEPDSHLDAIWQRLHSGVLNNDSVDNPEPFEEAPTRSFPKSVVLTSPVNSRTMSVSQLCSFVAFILNDISNEGLPLLPDQNKVEIVKLFLKSQNSRRYGKDLNSNHLLLAALMSDQQATL